MRQIRRRRTIGTILIWIALVTGLLFFCHYASGAEQAMKIDTVTHEVLAPPASDGATYDFDFTGKTVGGIAGGGGAPGGLSTQLQYNNAGAFAGIPVTTFNGTAVLQHAGNKFGLVDPIDPTKNVAFQLGNITTGAGRNITIPDGNSVTVMPDAGAANNFLTGITSFGVITKAQPTFANLTATPTTIAGYGITDGVVGPGSATDLSYPLWDGATGKLLQSSPNLTADGAGTLKSRHSSSASGVQSSTIEMYSIDGGGAATNNFGTTLDYYLESSTQNDRQAGRVGVAWLDATDATRTSYMDFWLVNNAAIWASKMRLFPSGGLSVNNTTDPGAGYINPATGIKIGGTALPISGGTTGQVLSKASNTNYDWVWSTVGGTGTVTNIATTSPITGGPITTTGTIGLNVGTDFLFSMAQTIAINDAVTNDVTNTANLIHNTTGTAANGLGVGLTFRGESSIALPRDQGRIITAWSDVTDASRTAYMDFQLVNNAAALASKMRLFPNGGLSVNSTTDPGVGFVNANSGFKIAGTNIIGTSVQAWDADLDDLSLKWLRATASGPSQLDFAEDTDNGTNVLRLTVPASISASTTFLTLPETGGADTVAAMAATQTLTNKRITKRVDAQSDPGATPTINTDNFDMVVITGQTADITSFTTNLSGTPTNGQTLWIAITGTAARAITWGASFEASTVALPTTTVSTNRLDVGFVWNVATSKFRCVAAQ